MVFYFPINQTFYSHVYIEKGLQKMLRILEVVLKYFITTVFVNFSAYQ